MNYLIKQYKKDTNFKIKHNYLPEQFSNVNNYIKNIKKVVKRNAFTLGEDVEKFENIFKRKIKSKYCVGVNSGTDAIFLSLKALNIGYNDEVLLPSFTFYATLNPIVAAGARPVFVDCKKDFNIDPSKIENKITPKTKAIVIVHWAGRVCDMNKIIKIAKKNRLKIIEDSCHAYLSKYKNIYAGNFGDTGCFSLHPLKNVNVWGDGGMIITRNYSLYKKIKLLRNHGLLNRERMKVFGYNSRLDTIQAGIGIEMIKTIEKITKLRNHNAKLLDSELAQINEITLPERNIIRYENFQLYCFIAKKRDKLIKFLRKNGVDAKIHYPIPMHKQEPVKKYIKKKESFPNTEFVSKNILSLPVHQYINKKNIRLMIHLIKKFYNSR